MGNDDTSETVEMERRNLLDATRAFRSQLITLEREHLQAFSDAVMRSRLAYIRFLDNFIRSLTYRRLNESQTLIRVANHLLRSELNNAERDDDVQIRRRSVYVSLADIMSQFNNEGGVDDNYLSFHQESSFEPE